MPYAIIEGAKTSFKIKNVLAHVYLGASMEVVMKVSKYIHVIYYLIALAVYGDLGLAVFAPDLHMGIIGVGCLLGAIVGAVSTYFVIKKKSYAQLIINIGIPISILLIILCVPGL